MTPDETRAFALRLMQEVWEPFGHEAVETLWPMLSVVDRGQTISRHDISPAVAVGFGEFSNPRYDIRQLVAPGGRLRDPLPLHLRLDEDR